MNRLAEFAMLSFGWPRFVLLLAAGGLSGLAMPPFYALPILFLTLPVWVWCLDGAEPGKGRFSIFGPAFRIGLSFGLGYFIVSLHWIGAAFFVDGGIWLVLMPFAVLALAFILALFWGLASAFAFLRWTHGPWRVVILALSLTAFEWLRGHLFSGFPFNLLGMALTGNDWLSQLASITGVYGLTLIMAIIGFMPALIWPSDERSLTRRLIPFFLVIVIVAAQLGYGQFRLETTEVAERTDLRLRLVQPNIAQNEKWQAESRSFTMDRLLELSETRLTPQDDGLAGVTAVIWPESAMPFYLSDYPEELARISRMLPLGKYLVTGAPRLEFGVEEGAFNSVLIINTDGEIISSYDKNHLVPFGEFLPFSALWAQLGIKQFVPGSEGWIHGAPRRVLSAPGLPGFLPLICYEAVFPDELGAPTREADFLLNLTNDGWFDGSIGPAQHFAHARLRAVEQGKALVRVANSGVTALVDPLGRVTAQLAQGQPGVLDVAPQQSIASTPYARFGDWPLLGLLIIWTIAMLRRRRRSI